MSEHEYYVDADKINVMRTKKGSRYIGDQEIVALCATGDAGGMKVALRIAEMLNGSSASAPTPPSPHEQELASEVQRLTNRLDFLAVGFGVPDGGKYLTDWQTRIRKYQDLTGVPSTATTAEPADWQDQFCALRDMWDEDECPSWPEVSSVIEKLCRAAALSSAPVAVNAPVARMPQPLAWQWKTHDTWHTVDSTSVSDPEAYAKSFGLPARPIFASPSASEWRDITMSDVRLIAGEGKLSAHETLAAVNGHMRLRLGATDSRNDGGGAR